MRLAPLRGVCYTPRAGEPSELMFTPPTSWSSVPAELLPTLDPHHILHLLAPAFGGDPEAGARESRTTLHDWLASGVMRRDDEPALYVYEQPGTDATVRGVIGVVDNTTPSPAFLAHEEIIETLADIQRTLEHTVQAHIEPILALHRGAPALRELLDDVTTLPPDLSTPDTVAGTHRLWRVTDAAVVASIIDAIPDEPCLIADGHHRHAAWRHNALTLLSDVEQPGLLLGSIHRVVTGLDVPDVLASSIVHTEPLADRAAAVAYLDDGPEARCVLYAAGRFYATTPAVPTAQCAAPELAVCHLHSHWLPRWGASEAAVGYVHDIDEAIDLAGDDPLAVLLPVPRVDDVLAAARDGRPLPRKATSFRPKPLVGTVLNVWGS